MGSEMCIRDRSNMSDLHYRYDLSDLRVSYLSRMSDISDLSDIYHLSFFGTDGGGSSLIGNITDNRIIHLRLPPDRVQRDLQS